MTWRTAAGLAALAAAILTFPPSTASAQAVPPNVVVAATGDDGNPGTAAQPKRTLSAAVAVAQPGSTIFLRGGLHEVRDGGGFIWRGGAPGRPLTVRSWPGERALLQSAPGNYCVGTDQDHVVIRDLDCRGAQGIAAFGVENLTITGVSVTDITGDREPGISVGGLGNRTIVVTDNVVERVNQSGIAVGGLRARSGSDVIVAGNRVRRSNRTWASPGALGGWGSGISVVGMTNVRIERNVVRESHGEGINCPLSSGCRVRDNVVADAYNALYYADNTTDSIWERNVGWTTGNPEFTRNYGGGPAVASGFQVANEIGWFEGPGQPIARLTIRNNVIIDANGGFAFGSYDNAAAGMTRVLVANNSFVRVQCGVSLSGAAGSANRFVNNLVVPASGGADTCLSGTAATAFATNLWAGGAPGAASAAGDVRAAPRFVVGSGTDPVSYRLQAGTPGVDAGTTLAAAPTDFARTARPQGARHDIGAFER